MRAPRVSNRLVLVMAASFLMMSAPSVALAQMSQSEVPEHPVVKFYPGALIDDFEIREFDGAEMITGYSRAPQAFVRETIEGKISRYNFIHPEGQSSLQVVRNFENALREAGFTTVVVGKVEDLPEMENQLDRSYFAAFRADRNGAPALYVNLVVDAPMSTVRIAEPDRMEQAYAVDASSLLDGLRTTGRVTVDGVNFDTSRATLRPESTAVLSEVKAMLEANPQLKLTIEGHTDNVGGAARNQTLSEQRAAEVKNWLVGHGVAADRLATAGFGDSRPVADNDSDEGRARNRRVELVSQG